MKYGPMALVAISYEVTWMIIIKTPSSFYSIVVITNETHALCEVGGNIFERCLDPGTNMHALTKINPEASWVIKKRTNT